MATDLSSETGIFCITGTNTTDSRSLQLKFRVPAKIKVDIGKIVQ